MSGETEQHVSGWTVDTLHVHLSDLLKAHDARYEQRFVAQHAAMQVSLVAAEKAVQTALSAAEKAVAKAESATEKRFDAVNEFRGAYQDIIAQQMPRAEAEQRLSALLERIEDVKIALVTNSGRSAGLSAGWSYLIGGIGLVLTICSVIIAVRGL